MVGHLNKNDANQYWANVIMVEDNINLLKKYGCDLPTFESVYSVCGGSMFLMNKFWQEFCEAEGGRLIGQDPGNFSMVLQEQRKLYAGLEPLKTLTHNDQPM